MDTAKFAGQGRSTDKGISVEPTTGGAHYLTTTHYTSQEIPYQTMSPTSMIWLNLITSVSFKKSRLKEIS